MDTLYLVEGFDNFEKTGVLSGVTVKSDSQLEVKFKKPFRLALDHLSGVRFAVAKKIDSEYIGTGQYQITKVLPDYIELIPNPHADEMPNYSKLEIHYIPYPKDMEALHANVIDVSMGHLFYNVPECEDVTKNLECLAGQETSHLVIPINGLNGRLFSDPKLRLALQYIVKTELQKDPSWKDFFIQGFELISKFFFLFKRAGFPLEAVNETIDSGNSLSLCCRRFPKKHQ